MFIGSIEMVGTNKRHTRKSDKEKIGCHESFEWKFFREHGAKNE